MNINKNKSKLPRINLCVIISLSLFLFYSCESKSPSGKKGIVGKPTQIIKNADILRSQNGQVEVKIKTPLVLNYEGDSAKMVFPNGVKVWFYNPDKSIKSFLTANYAINYNNSSKVFLKDSIKIINYNNKDTLYSQELIWDKDRKMIFSNKPIRRQNLSGIAYGDGFQSNEDMDSVRIRNPRGVQIVEEKE